MPIGSCGSLPVADTSESFSNHQKAVSAKVIKKTPLLSNGSSLLFLQDNGGPYVRVTNLSALYGLSHDREELVLENISFEINHSSNQLTVVGPVGSGKVRKVLHQFRLIPYIF